VSSPSVATLIKLAEALEVEVKDFFVFPEENRRHQAMALLEDCPEETLAMILRQLTKSAKASTKTK
jgi:hypothetical protein